MAAAAAAVPATRSAAVRSAVRDLVARRLSRELADQLLAPHPAEADGAGEPVVLDTSLPWPRLAEAYPGLLARAQRKQHGAWFTSLPLAAPTAARTLGPLLAAGGRPRVIDPAVGGGTFLIAALRELRAAGLPARDAAACLHGIDSDATAAALAALAVWAESGLAARDLPDVAARVRPGCGLLDPLPAGFDAVLTNPPWETMQAHADGKARIAELRPRFRHQGKGKLYTYRLFLERAHQLLLTGGRLGLVLPASLWFDRDGAPLRELLIGTCDWQWLFGFENTARLFPIDSRYRFAVVIAGKGGSTSAVRTSFGNTTAAAWADPDPPHTLYPAADLRTLSPTSGAFVEVEQERDLAILRRMTAAGVPACGPRGRFVWRQGDYNMTADRGRFTLRSDAERAGFRHDGSGSWRLGEAELLPLWQGAMLGDLHPSCGAHAGGVGHATAWRATTGPADFEPQYLVAAPPWRTTSAQRAPARIALRTLSNATNERTVVACLLPDVPCGNSLGVMVPRRATATPLRHLAAGAALLASLPFDWALRLRLSGINLNGFVLADCVLPEPPDEIERELAQLALRLCGVLPWSGPLWRLAEDEGWAPAATAATKAAERSALLVRIDVLAGRAFGLAADDVAWIVRGCDLPSARLRRGTPAGCHRRGFWRIDRTLDPADRRPNRWLSALR